MLSIALFWVSVLCLAGGIGVVFRGFYLMSKDGRLRSKDGQLGLRFVSLGSAIVMIGLAATFLRM
ncbi:MAG TPA: hypothetical protein VJS11_10560 [Acidobacteriaceae bacterium]|nr:hypothetical protein [Acidobacteriaceae bacterium]